VLVATADPLDQYLSSNPSYFHESSPEHALINPDNLLILLDHLRCAAFEIPFYIGEGFGSVDSNLINDFLDFLLDQGILHKSDSRYFWMADLYPAQTISMRSATPDSVLLQTWKNNSLRTIGQVDKQSANWMVHPGAIYIHEGKTFIVEELNLQENKADLRQIDTDYYTEPRRETTVELSERLQETQAIGSIKFRGDIIVTSKLIGFRKIKWYTHELIGTGEISLPPTELVTTGYWLSLQEKTVSHLKQTGMWKNDHISYGPNWEHQRNDTRARDQYRCQVCDAPETDREHDVHHKIPFRTFPSYEMSNRLDNLITLCQTCHRRAESAVRIRSGLSGLAFVLRHLAPLFLMCDRRDLGVFTDPQSVLGNGKPTVIIYDQVPAGIGLSQRLFEIHQDLISSAFQLVSSCSCNNGCPSCVGPGGEFGYGAKPETLSLLMALNNISE
jgi:DEAD/DEAH box helicase domain-containing protein